MIHAEEIIRAAGTLADREGRRVFTREEIRRHIGVEREDWNASYAPIFQAMRIDQPGGAPLIGERWRGVFRRVARGEYVLTDRGRVLVRELEGEDASAAAFHAARGR